MVDIQSFNKNNVLRTAATLATGLGTDALFNAGNLASHGGSLGVAITAFAGVLVYQKSSMVIDSLLMKDTSNAIMNVVDTFIDNKNRKRDTVVPSFLEANEVESNDSEEEIVNSLPAIAMASEGRRTDEEAPKKIFSTPVNEMLEKVSIHFGRGDNGQDIRFTLKQIKSMIILGLPEGGKTNTSMVVISQLLKQGARIVMIDKDGMSGSGDSLTAKLEPFSHFLDVRAGIDPQTAIEALSHLEAIMREREQDITKATCPIAVVIDEFTNIMWDMKDKDSDWHVVANKLHRLIKTLNTSGRKYGIFCLCIGQATNADSTGGTIIRDLFNTRVAHSMRINQAKMLQLSEYKESISRLGIGEALMDVAQLKDGPYHIKVPYISDHDLLNFAKDLRRTRKDISVPIQKKEQSFTDIWSEIGSSQINDDIVNEFMENTDDLYEDDDESQYPNTEELSTSANYRMALRIAGKNNAMPQRTLSSSHLIHGSSQHILPASHHVMRKSSFHPTVSAELQHKIIGIDGKEGNSSSLPSMSGREKEELTKAVGAYKEGVVSRRRLAHRLGITEHRASTLLKTIKEIEEGELGG